MANDAEFLLYRFRRRLNWEEAENGRVVVLRPRIGEGRIGRWLEALWGLSPYRIRLDEMGTFVWKHCDGKASAKQIADELRRNFGNKVEPAEDRLRSFLLQMSRARMIDTSSVDSASPVAPLQGADH
jgi:hypothetical protein